MTHTAVDKEAVTSALVAQWGRIRALLAGLPEAAWDRPTALPGWTVHDIVAHLIGTESMLAGESVPECAADVAGLPFVRNDIAALNQNWVESLRGLPPAEMLGRFEDVTGRRTAALEAMTQQDFDEQSATPVGPESYGRFMRIRVFDCWMHELDIRDAADAEPERWSASAETAFAELASALGFLVGKRAGAPDGSRVDVRLTGEGARTITVEVDGRARVVDGSARPLTAALTLPTGVFVRLAGGRVAPGDVRPAPTLEGDVHLAQRVLENLAFTI